MTNLTQKANSSFFFSWKERHGFHLVDSSPLPVATAVSAFFLILGIIFYWNSFLCFFLNIAKKSVFQYGFFSFVFVLFWWFLTVVFESGEGHHTQVVRKGLRSGMVLFIVSEIMFFFAFFWAFFHVSLSPAISLGCIWPPKSIQPLDIWNLPLTNTLLLLSSGLTLTLAHRALVKANNFTFTKRFEIQLFATSILGLTFLTCQFIEYKFGITFNWSETIYGSAFFVTTGFHGLHVTIGTIFLIFCLIRSTITTLPFSSLNHNVFKMLANYLSLFSFRKEQHIGFESAAWYWHFVDVVWIFLFITVYWWGN